MINSTSSSDRVLRPDGVVLHAKTPAAGGPEADRFAPEHTAALRAALASQPEIRADVVARAKVLATDPAYPSTAILRQVGKAILNSSDPADQAD